MFPFIMITVLTRTGKNWWHAFAFRCFSLYVEARII